MSIVKVKGLRHSEGFESAGGLGKLARAFPPFSLSFSFAETGLILNIEEILIKGPSPPGLWGMFAIHNRQRACSTILSMTGSTERANSCLDATEDCATER